MRWKNFMDSACNKKSWVFVVTSKLARSEANSYPQILSKLTVYGNFTISPSPNSSSSQSECIFRIASTSATILSPPSQIPVYKALHLQLSASSSDQQHSSKVSSPRRTYSRLKTPRPLKHIDTSEMASNTIPCHCENCKTNGNSCLELAKLLKHTSDVLTM